MSNYTFREECDSCGQVPSYNGHGLCDPCTTGEADTLWDWVEAWRSIPSDELPLMIEKIDEVLSFEGLVAEVKGDEVKLNPLVAHLLKVDKPEIWKGFEEIIDAAEKKA